MIITFSHIWPFPEKRKGYLTPLVVTEQGNCNCVEVYLGGTVHMQPQLDFKLINANLCHGNKWLFHCLKTKVHLAHTLPTMQVPTNVAQQKPSKVFMSVLHLCVEIPYQHVCQYKKQLSFVGSASTCCLFYFHFIGISPVYYYSRIPWRPGDTIKNCLHYQDSTLAYFFYIRTKPE